MKTKTEFQLYGILGFPLGHTLSPAMQESAFRDRNFKAYYLPLAFDRTRLKKFLSKINQSAFSGLNVTVPYKEDVFSRVGRTTEGARRVKAVNTLFRQGSRWIGDNTDVGGFLRDVKERGRFHLKGKRILVLGAGGAARAILCAAGLQKAVEVRILNRTVHRAKKLCREFSRMFPKTKWGLAVQTAIGLTALLKETDLVVNATSLGLKKNDRPPLVSACIPKREAGRRILFYDLIYSPPETVFLKTAREKGHRTLNGLGMLLEQGALSWERWTGKKAPRAVMKKTLLDELRKREKE